MKAGSPYKTLKDLLDEAKKRPGEIRAATTGILGDDHLAILMVEEAAKVKFRIVHFDGAAPMLTAALGGQVDVAFDNVGSVAPRIKGGELVCLGVMDPERSKFIPNIPTLKELGFSRDHLFIDPGDHGPQRHPGPHRQEDSGRFPGSHERPGACGKNGEGGFGHQTAGRAGICEILFGPPREVQKISGGGAEGAVRSFSTPIIIPTPALPRQGGGIFFFMNGFSPVYFLIAAIASISTFASRGNRPTWKADRAGGTLPKNSL